MPPQALAQRVAQSPTRVVPRWLFWSGVIAIVACAGLVSLLILRWYVEERLFPGPSTDAASFHQALAAYRQQDPRFVEHFPVSIGPEARNVRYFCQPGALQGGTWLELAISLPPEQIEAIAGAAAGSALGNPAYCPDSFQVAPQCGPFSQNGAKALTYVLGSGTLHDCWGVAIDRANSVVIYWMIDD